MPRNDSRSRLSQEIALRRATEALTASFSVDDMIRQIASSAIDATDADGSYVERIRGKEVEVVAVSGALHPPVGVCTPFTHSIMQRVLAAGRPALIEYLQECPEPLPGDLQAAHPKARALVVPLADAGEAIGALVLLRAGGRPPFTREDADGAHTFGNLAAVALRKVQLLEDTERRRAEMEQVMKSRTRLMRGFTHDLKNPIGAADGHAALLEDGLLGDLTEDQLRSVKRIRAALRNALQLIDDLNEFAKAETGRIAIDAAPVQVNDIARELAEQYRDIAEQAGITVDLELQKVPIITSDHDRIRQILANLLSNALKYTPQGGHVVVRTAVQQREAGGCVVVEVEDNGKGIPADRLHLLFEEFERIDPGGTPGLGLGLAISRRVAHALGGDIDVRSERDRGSCFTLWLPARASE